MRVAIVGAGVGGLTLANLLAREGVDIEIYERARQLEAIGAGFTLQPNGLRILEEIVDLDALRLKSAEIGHSEIYSLSGERMGIDIMEQLSAGGTSYSIHRGDLQEALLGSLPDSVPIHLKSEIPTRALECEERSAGEVSFAPEAFDVIVGCDGIKSAVRGFVSPTAKVNVDHGIAIRTMVERSSGDARFRNFRAWLGNGKVVLAYPVQSGEKLNIAYYTDSADATLDGWSSPIDIKTISSAFQDADPVLQELIGRARTGFSWTLGEVDGVSTWHRDNVVLVGDAAHAMVPYLGQGANQTIEDCDALSRALSDVSSSGRSLEGELVNYEAIRRPCAEAVKTLSREAGKIFKEDFGNVLEDKVNAVAHLLSALSGER